MSRAYASIAALTLVVLPSCGRSGDSSSAEACARVAELVRGLDDRVEVIDAVERAEGQVEIAYEYVDDQNLTVAGSATCAFAVGGPGSLELVEAIVDEEPLDAAAVTAANRVLAKRRL